MVTSPPAPIPTRRFCRRCRRGWTWWKSWGPTCCWLPTRTATGWAPPSSKTALPASSPATRWAASLSTTSPAPGRKTALCQSARWWLRASFPPPWRMPSARSTVLRSEIPSPALSTSGSRLRSWRRPGKRSGTSWALRKAMATFPVAMSGIRTRWMVRCLSVRWPPGTAPRGRTWERTWTRCTKSFRLGGQLHL